MVGHARRLDLTGRQEKLCHRLGVGMAVLIGGTVAELHPEDAHALGTGIRPETDRLENGRLRKLAVKTTGHLCVSFV